MTSDKIRPKKHLGQHFLKDLNVAKKIADAMSPYEDLEHILEVGPGMGVLTRFLMNRFSNFSVVETDEEAVIYLRKKYPNLSIIEGDFLKVSHDKLFGNFSTVGIIGNFPYNISSQILFRAITERHHVKVFAGMFQKELAMRICAKNNNKSYGILSVLSQAFYNLEYLFTVSPNVFLPPPKVESGVIRMVRKAHYTLPCDETLFFRIVKMTFNQRRKTIRNSLKSINMSTDLKENSIFDLRPEQLTVNQFVEIVNLIENGENTRRNKS